jgi:hypothetical protein
MPHAVKAPPAHHRVVKDHQDTVWCITESSAHDVPGAMALYCLIFDSPSVCRRLWRYPSDWETLPDDAVLELMDRPRIRAD